MHVHTPTPAHAMEGIYHICMCIHPHQRMPWKGYTTYACAYTHTSACHGRDIPHMHVHTPTPAHATEGIYHICMCIHPHQRMPRKGYTTYACAYTHTSACHGRDIPHMHVHTPTPAHA